MLRSRETFFLGSGSRYFFSAPVPGKKFQLQLHLYKIGSASKKTDFDTKHLKNLNLINKSSNNLDFVPKTKKKLRKNRFYSVSKNVSIFILSQQVLFIIQNHFVFHLPKKGARADPKKLAPAPAQILNRLRLQPKNLGSYRLRLRNTGCCRYRTGRCCKEFVYKYQILKWLYNDFPTQ